MNIPGRNPREMSDEETAKWIRAMTEWAGSTNGCAGAVGVCSTDAIKNPDRKDILKALAEKPLDINEISERVGVSGSALKFHLNFLQNSSFIEIEGNIVDLTPGGVSFIRSDKH